MCVNLLRWTELSPPLFTLDGNFNSHPNFPKFGYKGRGKSLTRASACRPQIESRPKCSGQIIIIPQCGPLKYNYFARRQEEGEESLRPWILIQPTPGWLGYHSCWYFILEAWWSNEKLSVCLPNSLLIRSPVQLSHLFSRNPKPKSNRSQPANTNNWGLKY